MFANMGDWIYVVVNAARADHDIPHIQSVTSVEVLDRALIALQGPKAEDALAALNDAVRDMRFMDARVMPLIDGDCIVTRSGYTGEDGFEISVPKGEAVAVVEALLEQEGVTPIGLGARDSLRLEAGLCLYGNDIDETTTAGTTLHAVENGPVIGTVTSGTFGPSVGGPVAMGYVEISQAQPDTMLYAHLRGKYVAIRVATLPFVQQTYKR